MLGGSVDIAGIRERYLKAVLAGERREALRIVLEDGVQRGVAPEVMRREVVQAAQREIGRLWEANTIGVADEHMATAISHIVLSHLFASSAPPPSNGRLVVVACVPGEQHDFPARLVTDALDLAGFSVRFLGADVPAAALVDAVVKNRPHLIALSVTMSFNVKGLRAAVAALRASAMAEVPIVIGGSGCESMDLATELGVAAQAREAEELVVLARRLTGLTATLEAGLQ